MKMRNPFMIWTSGFWQPALAFAGSGSDSNQNGNAAASARFVKFSDQKPDSVEARRRRRSDGPSGRAEMPGGPTSSSGRGSSGGDYQLPTSGGTSSRGGKGMSIGMVLLLVVVYFAYQFLSGGGNTATTPSSGDQSGVSTSAAAQVTPLPSRTPRPTTAVNAATAGQTWTIMLYEDADDPVLEADMLLDVNEAERVGSSDQVNIVVQLDRYNGGDKSDGNWTGARRYYLNKDRDIYRLNSELLDDLGEVSMSDPDVLVDFVTWSVENYPADNYVLILSDHGMGWPGGWTDPSPDDSHGANNPLSKAIDQNVMYTNEIDQALTKIRQQTGIDKFEMIGMDACLMSHLEVYDALAEHANYVVSSQETEPALGWAYASFLSQLEDNPGMNGADLGQIIVASYIDEDTRVQDESARADFLRQNSPMGGLFGGGTMSADALSRQLSRSVTLTVADMSEVPALMDAVNDLAFALQSEDQNVPARARTYAQSFTSIFGSSVPASYIDLVNFAQLVKKQSGSSAVDKAADAVINQAQKVVVAEKHGSEKPGANGISIYFPNNQLYASSAAGPRAYTAIADRFAKDSLWDDFLAFHYTEKTFDKSSVAAVVPDSGAKTRAPGSSAFELSQLQLSTTSTNYDEAVTMKAEITGSNIGYIYLFVGYVDPASNAIFVADKDYLEADETSQVGDLFYPVWSEGDSFMLTYDWLPTVFAISDGEKSVVALLEPVLYGANPDEAVYSADGIYTSADGTMTRYARMYFSSGSLQRVYGFAGNDTAGAPSEIIPQTGDQITLLQTWLQSDGSGGYKETQIEGQTLTFGDNMFTWDEKYVAEGQYVIGFVVSDLAGNEKQTFATVKVR